ncbi:MAG: hypothetical protein R3C18_08790 [Planctomycetaceae bacterium]
MTRLVPVDVRNCVPLRIGDGESSIGSRLGGSAPEGVRPTRVTSATRYFCTIRIVEDPVQEITVFLSFDFSCMFDCASIVHESGDVVEVVTHGESRRGVDPKFASELTPHPIHHGQVSTDAFSHERGIRRVRPSHKLGGSPFIQESEGLSDVIAELTKQGYLQILQIDFPSLDDGDIDGDWPFAGGMFHVFGREPFSDCLWKCLWQY